MTVPVVSPQASSRRGGTAGKSSSGGPAADPVGAGSGRAAGTTAAARAAGVTDDELIEAVLSVSRAMVALAEASIHQVNDDVTLAQYRTLVILAAGPSRLADLAEAMAVNPSTATRMCDRLVRKQLIERTRDQLDRREVGLSLTPTGHALVSSVTEQRRQLVRGLLRDIPTGQRATLVESLNLLSRAVGTAPTASWSTGWTTR